MSETNIVNTPTLAASYKMTIEETVNMLRSYATQADSSLAQLQANIDEATNKTNEWRRIQLMIVGQKKLLDDLINKTFTTPESPATDITSTEATIK